MPGTVTEKESCAKCGAEVREGTVFCYSCGGRVAPAVQEAPSTVADDATSDTQAALDDLARKLNDDDAAVAPKSDKEGKIATAAAERKKARRETTKERAFVWEPRSELPVGLLIAVAIVALAAVATVLITVV